MTTPRRPLIDHLPPVDTGTVNRSRRHVPQLVLSHHIHAGRGPLALAVFTNKIVGSPYFYLATVVWLIFMLVAGQGLGFDKLPWPLTLTLASIPQLPIGVAILVNGNIQQAVDDKRAIADHETLTALHTINRHQVETLARQDEELATLRTMGHDLSIDLLDLRRKHTNLIEVLTAGNRTKRGEKKDAPVEPQDHA